MTDDVKTALARLAGVAIIVASSWGVAKLEGLSFEQGARNAAEEAAEEKVRAAEDLAKEAEQRAKLAEAKLSQAHDETAAAVNLCNEAIEEVSEDLRDLERDLDRLVGAVEAFHGSRRTARVIERIPDAPSPPRQTMQKAAKVRAYVDF